MDDKNFCFLTNDSIFVRYAYMKKTALYLLIIFLSSCGYQNRMFKTEKEYVFATDSVSNDTTPYKIQPSDKLELHIFSNDGFKLVDITQNTSAGVQTVNMTYLVESTGETKFPVIGRVPMAGLTVKQAEEILQEKYKKYYNDPFVILNVTNRKAIVFLGDNGRGVVVKLENDYTSLYDVLALAGGISEFSRTYDIKILRGDPKNPKVFKADISTLEGLKNSELKVLTNDIIYVDVGGKFTRRLATDIIPLISILTSFLVIYTNLNR